MFLAFGVAQPLIKIMEFADHIMAITTTMGKVDEIMGMEELPQGVSTLPGADVLNMSHVSFGYGDTEVLHDVSFEVHKGQKSRICGAFRLWKINNSKNCWYGSMIPMQAVFKSMA